MRGETEQSFNIDAVIGLAEKAKAPHGRNQKSAQLPPPSPKSLQILADGIERETGLKPSFEILGRVLSYKNSRHIFNEHGNEIKEAARNPPQNQITIDHFACIPGILDKKYGTSYSGGNQPSLIHKGAGLSGVLFYVEIIDPILQDRLITMTMYEHRF